MSPPRPFRLEIPDAQLTDLRERLARTRLPDEPPLAPWSTGTSVAYMKELISYWKGGFDWRAQEAKLNSFKQYKVSIRGIDLHFIHEPGRGPNPMPLILSHGWPGSVWEFHKLIPLLTEHFTVVAPSLPGYTLSFRPGQERFGVEEIADTFAELMTDVLGYKRFGAQGGDWGSFVTSLLALRYPERLTGIHLNLLPLRRDTKMVENPTPEETKYLDQLKRLPEGRNRLPVDPGHQADNTLIRPHRLPRRPRRVDRRKIPQLDRQRRQHRKRDQPRRRADQHLPLLVHRRHRLVLLALLRPHAPPLADPRWQDHRRADGLRRVSEGNT